MKIYCLFVLLLFIGCGVPLPPKAEIHADAGVQIKAENEELAAMQRILQAGMPYDEHSFWHYVINNDVEAVNLFLTVGMRADIPNRDGMTPLSWACQYGYKDVVKALLDHGANPNHKDLGNFTPLGRVFLSGEKEEDRSAIIDMLANAGAKVNVIREDGSTLVANAAALGNFMMFQTLLDDGADPNLVGPDGMSALHFTRPDFDGSISEQRLMIRKLLIYRGAKN